MRKKKMIVRIFWVYGIDIKILEDEEKKKRRVWGSGGKVGANAPDGFKWEWRMVGT